MKKLSTKNKSVFLESERLYLSRIEDTDLAIIHLLDTDPQVIEFIAPPKTLEQSKERIQKTKELYDRGQGLGRWLAYRKKDHQAIGWYVLCPLDGSDQIEIGYRLLPQYWGQGYAKEMSKILLDYALHTLKLQEVVGVTNPSNEGSKKVLTKIGLHYLGIRQYYNQPVSFFSNIKKL